MGTRFSFALYSELAASCFALISFPLPFAFATVSVTFRFVQDSFQTWRSTLCVMICAFAVFHHASQTLLCLLGVISYGCVVCMGWSSQKFLCWKCFISVTTYVVPLSFGSNSVKWFAKIYPCCWLILQVLFACSKCC